MLSLKRHSPNITGRLSRCAASAAMRSTWSCIASSIRTRGPLRSTVSAGAASQRADYGFRASDGTRREIGLSAAHLVTPDGRAGHLLTFQDVTEIRRLERDSRRRQRLAAVGEMAAGIAHEIRNPLASMRGSIQVLRSELRNVLQEAISELPEIYKSVLLLRDVEELSTEESAQVLDVSEDVVKTRLHRARLAVRQKLDQYLKVRVN